MKTVLLDVDDTIIDFHESAKATIIKAGRDFNIKITDDMLAYYMTQNDILWGEYEKGIIDRDEIFRLRFPLLFKEYGYCIDGIEFERLFQEYFKSETILVDGAKEFVEYLYSKYDLYVASNSLMETQQQRLKKAGLINYFKDIFVSDVFACQKPTRQFFDCCFSKIVNFDKNETIIIGDSLTSDIKGGCTAGIKTCWFNPFFKINNTEFKPDFEINKLSDIKGIL